MRKIFLTTIISLFFALTSLGHEAFAMSRQDEKTTQKIRLALFNDSSVSHAGKNIQIDVINGEITLKGTVPSLKEKKLIEKYAEDSEALAKVKNELVVAP